METEANDLDHLVNYYNDNDIDELVYKSKVYLLEEEEEEKDENNHSNWNVVKTGITRKKLRTRLKKEPLKVDHGTNAMTTVLDGKVKGGDDVGKGIGRSGGVPDGGVPNDSGWEVDDVLALRLDHSSSISQWICRNSR
nr:hypothetical protein [Tanacetum cinerariifolium]